MRRHILCLLAGAALVVAALSAAAPGYSQPVGGDAQKPARTMVFGAEQEPSAGTRCSRTVRCSGGRC